MKAALTAVIAAIALASFGVSAATQSESAMQDCFKMHAQMMDKPAVKNMRDCWRTHGYLMQKA